MSDGLYSNLEEDQGLRSSETEFPSELNFLVVKTGTATILVDAGVGKVERLPSFNYPEGMLIDNLIASGTSPDDIDYVLISHLHPDHILGLADQNDERTFKNAQLVVSRQEWDYWTNSDLFSNDDLRAEFCRLANHCVRPYDASIRLVGDGEEVVSGVKAMLTPGHSAADMTFLFESEGEVLAAIGDLSHHYVFESAHPEWFFSLLFDEAPQLAVQSRRYSIFGIRQTRCPRS